MACSQTSSLPPATFSTATRMMPWLSPLGTAQHQHTVCQHRRLKAPHSGGGKKTVPPLSRTICHSVHCLEQLYPNTTRLPWDAVRRHAGKDGVPFLDRVTSAESLHQISELQLVAMAAYGLQDGHKKPSLLSVGEYDSMSICETLCDESCLGPTSRCHAVIWLPSTSPASSHRTIWPTFSGASCRVSAEIPLISTVSTVVILGRPGLVQSIAVFFKICPSCVIL